MTGLEVVAGVAVAGAIGKLFHDPQVAAQEKLVSDIYKLFFKKELAEEVGSDRGQSVRGPNLADGIDSNAADCICAIERYQKDRMGYMLGVPIHKAHAGDFRTLVFEEMKDWLETVKKHNNPDGTKKQVSMRLEYCRQILLQGQDMSSSNKLSFLQTLGIVIQSLEKIVQRLSSEQTISKDKLKDMIADGFEVVTCTMPLLFYALAQNAFTCGDTHLSKSTPPPAIAYTDMIAAANAGKGLLDWTTDYGQCLRCLLSTEYFQAISGIQASQAPADAGEEGSEAVSPGADTAGTEAIQVHNHSRQTGAVQLYTAAQNSAQRFSETLNQVRQRWTNQDTVDNRSGLMELFRDPRHKPARLALLHILEQIDKMLYQLAYFGKTLERVAGIAGDLAMCWFNPVLVDFLQKTEGALMQLRSARTAVMSASKLQLQVKAKDYASTTDVEATWMQGLRHIDEFRLDDLYCALVTNCTDLRTASSAQRATELKKDMQDSLQNIVKNLESADFQARCKFALPEDLLQDLMQIANNSGNAGGSLAVTNGSLGDAPRALAPP